MLQLTLGIQSNGVEGQKSLRRSELRGNFCETCKLLLFLSSPIEHPTLDVSPSQMYLYKAGEF